MIKKDLENYFKSNEYLSKISKIENQFDKIKKNTFGYVKKVDHYSYIFFTTTFAFLLVKALALIVILLKKTNNSFSMFSLQICPFIFLWMVISVLLILCGGMSQTCEYLKNGVTIYYFCRCCFFCSYII